MIELVKLISCNLQHSMKKRDEFLSCCDCYIKVLKSFYFDRFIGSIDLQMKQEFEERERPK